VLRQFENVRRAFAQRRYFQVHDVDRNTVLAEGAFAHRVGQIPVRVAMMRISIGTGLVPPTRSITRS